MNPEANPAPKPEIDTRSPAEKARAARAAARKAQDVAKNAKKAAKTEKRKADVAFKSLRKVEKMKKRAPSVHSKNTKSVQKPAPKLSRSEPPRLNITPTVEIAADALLANGFKFSWSALPIAKPEPKDKKKKAGVKVKYTCTCCDTSFWGKTGIKATCQEGGEDFVQEGNDGGEDDQD